MTYEYKDQIQCWYLKNIVEEKGMLINIISSETWSINSEATRQTKQFKLSFFLNIIITVSDPYIFYHQQCLVREENGKLITESDKFTSVREMEGDEMVEVS